jgi:hypothetical protein
MNLRIRRWRVSVLWFLLVFQNETYAQSWGMNEVSQLLPLPSVSEFDVLLRPADQGTIGELLPYSAFKLLPLLTDQADQDSLYQNNLKVIGIRIDPCFGEGVNPPLCRHQIRLVWQPLVIVGDQVTTLDTAIHTFHEFNESDWQLVLTDFRMIILEARQVHRNDFNDSLQIQPVLRAEGYRGNYWKKLREFVLRYCGNQNLIRATAMTVRMSRLWTFSGIDRTATGWSLIHIPTLDIERPVSQTFMLTPEGMENLEEFAGGISYLPKTEAMWFRLASDSKRVKELQSTVEIKSIIQRAIRLENPRMHNPGTADCVSCHMAQTVRLWGEKNFPHWNWQKEFGSDRFKNSNRDLRNNSVNPFQTDRVRAFGYFGDDPIISQRVIHETALVSDALK